VGKGYFPAVLGIISRHGRLRFAKIAKCLDFLYGKTSWCGGNDCY
jgi:hypothetical protein